MQTIKRSEFEANKADYSKLTLVKTYNNGSEDYSYNCECPRCMGKGIVYTHVLNGVPIPATPDSGICYLCGGSRVISAKIHVVSDEAFSNKIEKARAKAEINMKKAVDDLIARRINEGYKSVDFDIADWFTDSNVGLFKNGYYHIEKETEKAVLISFVGSLDIFDDYLIWMPKKAIVRR